MTDKTVNLLQGMILTLYSRFAQYSTGDTLGMTRTRKQGHYEQAQDNERRKKALKNKHEGG